MSNNNTELEIQFATLLADNDISKLSQWRKWKAENKDEARQYKELVDVFFEEIDLFEEHGKKGRGFNHFTYEEWKAFVKANGLTSRGKYITFREKAPDEIKERLPFDPKGVYTTIKSA